MHTDRKPMVGPGQTARQVGLSRSHFDQLVPLGMPCVDATLPGRKRRTLRFDVDEVRQWLASRRKVAA
jgi:predicted DNA-binding transcriptional regulator AlpA